MKFRIIATLLVVIVFGVIVAVKGDLTNGPAASSQQDSAPSSNDDAQFKTLKIN